jgi:hypothetical protein
MRGVQAEGQHRGYAIAGQVIADLNSGPRLTFLWRFHRERCLAGHRGHSA